RAVRETQAADAGVHAREREVLADAAAAVHLDCAVDDLEGHRGRGHLDRSDLGARALVAYRVHEPGSLHGEQTDHLELDARFGDPVRDVRARGAAAPDRDTPERALAHELERALGSADRPHAVMDPAGPEPRLADEKAVALLADQVRRRDADVLVDDLAVPL